MKNVRGKKSLQFPHNRYKRVIIIMLGRTV